MSNTRIPRKIDHLAGGPDKRATNLSNALYVIEEFVSPRRLATLAVVPTRAELIGAVDLYMTCESNETLLAHARALRSAAETWAHGAEVPASVHAAAKAILSVLSPAPPGGWDMHDGYDYLDETPGTGPTSNPASSERIALASEQAAQAAQAMMHALDLAALLASPRVLRQATEMPSGEHLIEHIDTFINVLSGDAISSPSVDIATTRDAAIRLRAACTAWSPGPLASVDVLSASRALLASFGIDEPPEGWDAFEGR